MGFNSGFKGLSGSTSIKEFVFRNLYLAYLPWRLHLSRYFL